MYLQIVTTTHEYTKGGVYGMTRPRANTGSYPGNPATPPGFSTP